MGEYIRLPNGEQLKLGTCGDWRYVRLEEARGLLLEQTRRASRHPHDTDLAHALTGRTVGGPAKTAVVSSAFMGMLRARRPATS